MQLISSSVNIPVIASGGMGSIEHGISVVKESNADAVAIANVLHYKTLNISEIRSSFQRAEINVREYEKS
jgi:cyclase